MSGRGRLGGSGKRRGNPPDMVAVHGGMKCGEYPKSKDCFSMVETRTKAYTYFEYLNSNSKPIPVRGISYILSRIEVEQNPEPFQPHGQHSRDGFFHRLRMLILDHEQGGNTLAEN